MELSNEIKAKVFAQYIGQTCQTNTREAQGEGQPFKRLNGVLKEVDLGMATNFIGVLLENETDFSNHTNYNPEECKLILKGLSSISELDIVELAEIIHYSTYKNVIPNYRDIVFSILGNQFNGNLSFDIAMKMCQFLVSKGYDLPHYLLGGKTLKDAGLAIYES